MNNCLASFTDIINSYLEDKNFNVAEFSRSIGIADNVIHTWVTAQYYPSFDCVIKIADYFDYSIDYLFGLTYTKSFERSISSNSFSDRFNILLLERNLTPYKLSKKLWVSDGSAYGWTRGRMPRTENIISLAKFFNVSIDYLLGRSDNR